METKEQLFKRQQKELKAAEKRAANPDLDGYMIPVMGYCVDYDYTSTPDTSSCTDTSSSSCGE
jgi:hypothetical protein